MVFLSWSWYLVGLDHAVLNSSECFFCFQHIIKMSTGTDGHFFCNVGNRFPYQEHLGENNQETHGNDLFLHEKFLCDKLALNFQFFLFARDCIYSLKLSSLSFGSYLSFIKVTTDLLYSQDWFQVSAVSTKQNMEVSKYIECGSNSGDHWLADLLRVDCKDQWTRNHSQDKVPFDQGVIEQLLESY